MKFLLVAKYSVIEPLGLLFLESSLRKLGVEVDLCLIGAEPLLTYDEIVERNYDFIGFSTFTGFHKNTLRDAVITRDKTFAKIIIGGPHATFFSEDCLPYADYVVVGEGFKSLEKIIRGEAKYGKVFEPELVPECEIPIPYRKTLYQTYPSYFANPIKNVMASFGCPFSCSYCWNDSYSHLYKEKIVRFRPVDSIIEECKEIKKYPLELIFFQDDCFGSKMIWLEEFCERYVKEIGVPFHCQIRPEFATLERLRILKSAGCHGVTMAIETFNEKTRVEKLNRKMRDSDIHRACYLVRELGLKLRTEQMLGLPDTTLEDELKLLEFNVRVKPNIAWTSIFAPYLGTELGDYCKREGLYDGNNDDLDDSFFSNSRLKFDPERLRKTNQLQRIFSTCARMPEGDKLARLFLDKETYDFNTWFSTVRKHLYDSDLYRVAE